MTVMYKDPETGVWKSGVCEHCEEDLGALAASVPERVDEKPDLKAAPEVLP